MYITLQLFHVVTDTVQRARGKLHSPASLGSSRSPSGHSFMMNERVRTPSGNVLISGMLLLLLMLVININYNILAMVKSPSALNVGSTQSIAEELSLLDFRYSRSLPHHN